MRISDWSSDVCSSDLEQQPQRLAYHSFTELLWFQFRCREASHRIVSQVHPEYITDKRHCLEHAKSRGTIRHTRLSNQCWGIASTGTLDADSAAARTSQMFKK